MSGIHNLLIMDGKNAGFLPPEGNRGAIRAKLGAKATWDWVGIRNLSVFLDGLADNL
jgi:hypothetical protein